MSITAQRYLAVAVAVTLGLIGAIQLGNPDTLGITPRITAWLGIVSVGLGILAGFLPNVRATTKDPKVVADRFAELSDQDQRLVIADLEERRLARAGEVIPHG